MHHFRKDLFSIFVYLISIVGLLFYLYGFFPNNRPNKNPSTSSVKENSLHTGKRVIDKLVLIVIDSLRYDFVSTLHDEEALMPFITSSIMRKQSCLLTTTADSPTVTMPRIKAMTSGTSSNYVDVVLNLMSSQFEEDNFVTKAVSNGLKLVFYGDDTWLKLFPDAFLRSEGTSSFFVMDFSEVDNNVTRHIHAELLNNDWDVLILHYLGLDHIGHVEGPNSPLVKPKLKEMDDIVKKIHNHLSTLHLKTMVLVTGDHGMKDSGGHGGISYPEVTVPLISVGNPCRILPGWPERYTALQIDLAPTLCVLLGLSLPKNSVGKLMPNLLSGLNDDDVMFNLEINRLQLTKAGSPDTIIDVELKRAMDNMKDWISNKSRLEGTKRTINSQYFKHLSHLSQSLSGSASDFKLFHLFLGLLLLWLSLFLFVIYVFFNFPRPQRKSHWFLILGVVLHGLSLGSTSFIEEEHQTWYFLWVSLCLLIVLECVTSDSERNPLRKVINVIPWIVICCVHRLLRNLNQTGDKWAFLPDIKAYLNSVDGQKWLFALFFTGLAMSFLLAVIEHCPKWYLLSYSSTLLCICLFRIATRSIQTYYLKFYPASRGTAEVFFFWFFLLLLSIQTCYYKTPKYLLWLPLGSLLLRPHNVILLPIEVIMSKEIHRTFGKHNPIWNGLVHWWLGNVFYFYQGNGNSLANVDVTAAFVGVKTYYPVYAGLMVAAHTFNAQILSFILSKNTCSVVAISKLVPLTLYCSLLIFQMNHLFIWSVFSPKLLYEASMAVLVLLLIVLK